MHKVYNNGAVNLKAQYDILIYLVFEEHIFLVLLGFCLGEDVTVYNI